jgi:hypothetical protein
VSTPIFKAAPEVDLYMEWSTMAERPAFIGGRAEIKLYLVRMRMESDDESEERLQRADTVGSSALHADVTAVGPVEGAWDDDGVIVEQHGFLPRPRFAEFMRRYGAAGPSPYDLLEPLDDDEHDES